MLESRSSEAKSSVDRWATSASSKRLNRGANRARNIDRQKVAFEPSAPGALSTFVIFHARTHMEDNDVTHHKPAQSAKSQCF
jgi:hypothetical protein